MVSLLLLLVITLLGITSMQTSLLEERMAGNQRHRAQAFQEAESALRAAEKSIVLETTNATVLDPAQPDDPFHPYGSIEPAVFDWSGFAHHDNGSQHYVVEYLGCRDISGNSAKMGTKPCQSASGLYLFRAWGRGASGSAVRVLRSHYVTDQPL